MFAAAWSKPNAAVPKLLDFLPHLRAWEETTLDERYSDLDREVLAALGAKLK